MEPERQEVYERIPWETLEKKGNDRQWLVYALAGAVALGALAYSFMRNQPTAPPPVATETTAPVPSTTPASQPATPTTVASPVVIAEADLFAVDPERIIDQAASHAEWFAVEFVAVDGSEQSRDTLSSLLPEGIPLPEAPEDTQVFVDWARARSVDQTGPVSFEVEVLVRSLLSNGDSGFVRQPPLLVEVDVTIDEDGLARVAGVPSLTTATALAGEVELSSPPDDVRATVEETHEEIVGGIQGEDGSWEIVVMVEGSDGVRRPVSVQP
jgi:hypothetical protein